MSDLLGVIQQIGQQGNDAMKPTDIAFGTVTSLSPLQVQLESTMQSVPETNLVKTVGVVAKSYSGTDSEGNSFTVTINEGLAVGDKVVMLRTSHGQRFILLSKVY